MTELSFTVPLIPPSVNHYKEPIIVGRGAQSHISYAITPEGRAYKSAVAIFAKRRTIAPETDRERLRVRYELDVLVIFGKKQRGDGDNFWKCIADGLVEAGVIHSDARVKRWVMEVDDTRREENNPRTEITARVIGAKTA